MFSKGVDAHSYTVNVIKDFPWTSSPQNAESIGDVPEMHLRELNVEFNPFINQMLNNIAVINQQTQRAVRGGKEKIEDIIRNLQVKEKECENTTEGTAQSTQVNKQQSAGEKGLIGKGLDFLEKHTDVLANKKLKSWHVDVPLNHPEYNPMAPYERLYETSPTGWKYKLPFFDDNFRSIGSSWGGGSSNPVLGGIGAAAAKSAQFLANTLNFVEPGVYIEQPSSFQFSGRNKSFTVSFPLINTRTYDEVIRNWQLIFLLTYQNLPNRVSRSIITPPVIYEALVPGMWYSKYAYISNLTVSFIGARRKMTLRLPTVTKNVLEDFLLGQTDITTIIPDAYNISMTVSELFGEAQNHMYTALKMRYLNNKVRTGEMDNEGTIIGNIIDTGKDLIGGIKESFGL
jgi:hypothetical protein